MVHARINERYTTPNPCINFITALPSHRHTRDSIEDPEATDLLRTLAAQLKPVMKEHGFVVNSFEEYENNKVFLGRNWNNGETVELVLRDGSGQFYPISMLLSVFCHELAHIKHMNHSADFHTLRRQLSAEVATLQRKGYYGDGYWSAGTRLKDSYRVSGDAQSVHELPEYTCGGAHTQSRSSALPSRRRQRRTLARGPSLSTGVQTAKRRKAGSRVVSKSAFGAAGGGSVLDERVKKGGKGSGFRKQAGSQRAREERALAAERRLLQQGEPVTHPEREQPLRGDASCDSECEGEDEGFDERCAPETDGERLKMMRDLMGDGDLGALRDEYEVDAVLVSDVSGTFTDPSGVKGAGSGKDKSGKRQVASDSQAFCPHFTSSYASSSREATRTCGNAQSDRSHDDFDEGRHAPMEKHQLGCEHGPTGHRQEAEGTGNKKRRLESDDITAFGSGIQASTSGPSLRGMVGAEMRQRKREGLGMDRGRRLGGMGDVRKAASSVTLSGTRVRSDNVTSRKTSVDATLPAPGVEWSCSKCTFVNAHDRETCAMCDGTRGWACTICTFENSGGMRCKICDRPRV